MAPANRPDPQAQKQALIKALNEHRINTIGELRRVERIFATLGSSDVTQPMTSACTNKGALMTRIPTNFQQGYTTSIRTASSRS